MSSRRRPDHREMKKLQIVLVVKSGQQPGKR